MVFALFQLPAIALVLLRCEWYAQLTACLWGAIWALLALDCRSRSAQIVWAALSLAWLIMFLVLRLAT